MEISSPNLDIILILLKTLLKRANSTELRITKLYKYFFGNDIRRTYNQAATNTKETREEIKQQYVKIHTLETTISQLKTELKLEKSNSVVKIDVANAIFSTENDALREEIQRLKLIVLNSNEAHNTVLEEYKETTYQILQLQTELEKSVQNEKTSVKN